MNNLKGKNILVTGGTGFVGSHLIEELVKQKANIVTTFQSINPRSYFFTQHLNNKVVLVQLDVCNYDGIFDLVTKYDIEYIFHLAAQPLVGVAYHNPKRTLYSNILGTINVLECARSFSKVKGVIAASSDKSYGKLDKKKYLETDPLLGDHPYEVSKSSAYFICYSYFKTYHVPVVVTRFGNVYGEGDLNFSRIIPGIMKSIVRSETLDVRSNGEYVRDYLYVKDVVDGYLLLANNINKIKGEAFNFGSEESLSVIELIRLTEKILNKKVRYKILNRAKNEIPYQSLDYSKIKKKLRWKPKFKLKKVLKNVKKWYENILR